MKSLIFGHTLVKNIMQRCSRAFSQWISGVCFCDADFHLLFAVCVYQRQQNLSPGCCSSKRGITVVK